jgi:hypothetical protein
MMLLVHHKKTFAKEIDMIKAATDFVQHGDGECARHYHEDVRKGAEAFRKESRLW